MANKLIGKVTELQPIWLDTNTASQYLGICTKSFRSFAVNNSLSAYKINSTVVYNIHEINESIKSNPLIKKI